MKKFDLILLLLIPCTTFGNICFYTSLKERIEESKKRPETSRYVFIKAKVIGRNTTVYSRSGYVNPVNVKILEYWHDKEINFESDTLTIFDDALNSSKLTKDSIHLFTADLDFDIYRTTGCFGNERFSTYSRDELKLLGKSFKVQPRYVANEHKSIQGNESGYDTYKIMLIISTLLNVILVVTLVIKRKSST